MGIFLGVIEEALNEVDPTRMYGGAITNIPDTAYKYYGIEDEEEDEEEPIEEISTISGGNVEGGHTKGVFVGLDIEKENENVDEFIFLGDYFDDWNETPQTVKASAEFVSEYIHDDKFKFLIGNHDLHYIINHRSWIASTWTEEKFNTINEIIDEDMWSKFLWTYHKDNWLFSHAGINSKEYYSDGLDEILNEHIAKGSLIEPPNDVRHKLEIHDLSIS